MRKGLKPLAEALPSHLSGRWVKKKRKKKKQRNKASTDSVLQSLEIWESTKFFTAQMALKMFF